MKKILFTCFLGGLCLFGSETPAKVASPRDSLVGNPGPRGQEESIPSARMGESNPILIYGEIISPESVSPIKLELTPYYVDRKSSFLKEDFILLALPGGFFDGVVDPRARKFSAELPALKRPAYISLSVGDKMLLEQYLIFPGDSLKIGINLNSSGLVFGGPAAKAFELQYQLKRLRLQQEFDRSRKIVISSPESLLDQQDHREQWESNNRKFGSRLEFSYYGPKGLEQLLGQLSAGATGLEAENEILGFYSRFLEHEKTDLIRLETHSSHYLSPLSMLYRFYYGELDRYLSPDSLQLAKKEIRDVLEDMPDREFRIESKLVSADYLDLQVEKLSLLALIDQVSYLDLIDARFDGELADRLKASFLTRNLRRYPEPEKMIGQYLKEMKSEPWKERIRTLGESTIPGSSLIALELEDTEGNILTSEVLKDNPTLLYFYFSTCVHSAHYFQDMLWPMYQDLAKEKGVQLIAVSVDKDRSLWLSNIPKYSNPQISNYRLTEKSKQEFVQFYEVSGYPRTFLIDSNREIVAFGLDRSAYSKFEEDFLKHLSKLSETTSTPNPPTP